MKLIYLLILIVEICIVIAFIFLRLENTRKEVHILKKKYENIHNLIETSNKPSIENKSPKKSSSSIDLSSSSSSTISVKKPLEKKETNIFDSLGLPNIFDIFSGNMKSFQSMPNLSKIIIQPNIPNLDESTSDCDSVATSLVESLSIKNSTTDNLKLDGSKLIVETNKISSGNLESGNIEVRNLESRENNLEVKNILIEENEEETEIDNGEHIEVYSNSSKSNKSPVADPSNNESVVEEPGEEPVEELVVTIQNSTTTSLDKKYLESLKVNDIKNLAKNKNINLFIGKKAKNKSELINDLIKI
jgi:hypothetical protein